MELPKIKLPEIDKKYKIIGLLGILFLCLSTYYDQAYKPHAVKISELKEELNNLDSQLQVIMALEYPGHTNNHQIIDKIETKKIQLAKNIQSRENKLSSKANFSSMLEKITHLAQEAGLEVKSLDPKQFSMRDAYGTMQLQMNIDSRYNNIIGFLEKIQELPVTPESIKVYVAERPNLTVNLNLSVLFK